MSNIAFAIEIPNNHTLAIASKLWQKKLKERAALQQIAEMREKYQRLGVSEHTTEKDIAEFRTAVGLPVNQENLAASERLKQLAMMTRKGEWVHLKSSPDKKRFKIINLKTGAHISTEVIGVPRAASQWMVDIYRYISIQEPHLLITDALQQGEAMGTSGCSACVGFAFRGTKENGSHIWGIFHTYALITNNDDRRKYIEYVAQQLHQFKVDTILCAFTVLTQEEVEEIRKLFEEENITIVTDEKTACVRENSTGYIFLTIDGIAIEDSRKSVFCAWDDIGHDVKDEERLLEIATPKLASGAGAVEITNQLVENEWVENLYCRNQSSYEVAKQAVSKFVEPNHPLKAEVFSEIDILSDNEIVMMANRCLMNAFPAGFKSTFGFYESRALTVRQAFINPSVGGDSLSQALFCEIGFINDPNDLNKVNQEIVSTVKNRIKVHYLVFKALAILSKQQDLVLIQEEDVDVLLEYCKMRKVIEAKNFSLFLKLLLPVNTHQRREGLKNFIALLKKLLGVSEEFKEELGKAGLDKILPHKLVSPESERIHAVTFDDQIKLLQADVENSLDFIALGTSSLPGYAKGTNQHKALNPLITKLRSYCKRRDIKFTCGNPRTVYDKVREWKGKNKNARGIVLDSEGAIDKLVSKLKKLDVDLEADENVLLAGVDNKNMEENSYIRLMEMLSLTLELLRKGKINEKAIRETHEHLGFKQKGPRRISFVPDAKPMDYEELRDVYRLQIFA